MFLWTDDNVNPTRIILGPVPGDGEHAQQKIEKPKVPIMGTHLKKHGFIGIVQFHRNSFLFSFISRRQIFERLHANLLKLLIIQS